MKFKHLFKYTGDYRFNSLLFKNTVMLLLFSLLPLVIIIMLSNIFYSSSLKNEMVSRYTRAISLIENSFSTTIDGYMYHINNLLTNESLELLSYADSFEEVRTSDYLEIFRNISLSERTYSYTDSIYVYCRNVGIFTSSGVITKDIEQNPCIQAYYETSSVETRPHNKFYTFRWTKEIGDEKKNILSIAKPYVLYDNPNIVVFVNIDIKSMMEPIIGDYNTENGAFILESNGTPLFIHNRSSLSDAAIEDSLKNIYAQGDYQQIKIDGKEWMAIAGRPSTADLNYLFLIPMSQISANLSNLRIALYITIGFCVLLLLALALYISNRMYQPISNLLDSVNEIPFLSDKKYKGAKDEISYISDTLKRLATKQTELETQLQERIKLFQKAQFVALQSQITPHFLCNTLDNINWMAVLKLGGDNEISSMVTHLSNLLRVSLESSVSVHSFEKEINSAREYIMIMEKRYEGRFDVEWDIPNEIRNLQVPKITLQPIIENAIYHGIKPIDEKGLITIRTVTANNILQIIITDSGAGFSEKEIETINADLMGNYMKEDVHIGISNVNMRIKLLFGDSYGIVVGNCDSGGAKVTIVLPIKN